MYKFFSEICFIIRRNQRDIVNVDTSSRKVPLFLPDFSETWICLTDFQILFICEVIWKSVEWEPSCSTEWRTDRQTWES